MITRYSIHVTKLNTKSSIAHMSFHSILFWWKFIWCWALTKALLFCMNQFHKFHCLELRNLILTYFKNIFKNKENTKVACLKENGNQILLKMGFRYPKILRMENGKIWIIWKSEFEKNIYKMVFNSRKIIFKIKRERMEQG